MAGTSPAMTPNSARGVDTAAIAPLTRYPTYFGQPPVHHLRLLLDISAPKMLHYECLLYYHF